MGIVYSAVRTAARSSAYRDKVAAERKSAVVEWSRQQHAALDAKRAEVATRRPGAMPSLDQILTALRDAWFGRYLSVPDEVLDLCVLWAAHTHYREATQEGGQGHLAFRTSPRLAVLAPGNGYGKTTLAEMVGEVSANCFGTDQEPTEYGLIDALADEHATVILDEAGLLLGSGARKAAVHSVLLAYTAKATKKTGRNGGTRKSMFGPICFAATGDMATTTGDAFNALFERCFVVHMEKATPPADPDTRSEADAEIGRRALKYFADQTMAKVLERAVAEDLPIPAEVATRSRQLSRVLIAIGEAAGGDWLERAQRVCVYFKGTSAVTGKAAEDLAASFRTAFMTS